MTGPSCPEWNRDDNGNCLDHGEWTLPLTAEESALYRRFEVAWLTGAFYQPEPCPTCDGRGCPDCEEQ